MRDLVRDTASKLTFVPGSNENAVWTPDGKGIVFQATNEKAPGLYYVRADGSGVNQRLTDGKFEDVPFSFLPDGKRLAFARRMEPGNLDIFTVPVDAVSGGIKLGTPELFLGTPFIDDTPQFSPNGRWLAYTSNESGAYHVYVRPFPSSSGRWQVSTDGGRRPVWARNGHEILYLGMDNRIMAVDYVVKGDAFVAGKHRVWCETPVRDVGFPRTQFDLSPDGKEVAVILQAEGADQQSRLSTHLTFLLNFFDELRRRAP